MIKHYCVINLLHRKLEGSVVKGDYKMFKRFLATAMVVVMCLAMSSVAFASENISATNDITNMLYSDEWTTIKDAELVVDENGYARLEVPTTALETGIVPYGGAETWSSGSITRVGTFTMEGNNLTPVKTIGTSNYSYLGIRVDSFSCSKSVRLNLQIRRAYTTNVLGYANSNLGTSDSNIVAFAPVKNGDKVQIYFRITDANGNYDDNLRCTITYSYRLMNSPM